MKREYIRICTRSQPVDVLNFLGNNNLFSISLTLFSLVSRFAIMQDFSNEN